MPDQTEAVIGHCFVSRYMYCTKRSKRQANLSLIVAVRLRVAAFDCHANQEASPTLGQQINTQ
ncbi:MAG: hypothetical protein ACTJG9_04415, partial [Alcaligenes aquatilis]